MAIFESSRLEMTYVLVEYFVEHGKPQEALGT